jgi:hypothetical protein
MVIGLIAHDQMEPAHRNEVVRVLRLHPRFEEHFLAKMPDSLSTAPQADQDRWIFAYASAWCDAITSNKVSQQDRHRFNRGLWHYVNFPTFLNDRDKETMIGGLTVNLDNVPTGEDNFNWNIIQAFKNAQRVVSDPASSDEDKAVSLCWMFHLAGDSHQPLHSTALFTMGRFDQGDRGGNSIKTQPGSNLHSVWDGMIIGSGNPSKLSDYNDMRQRAQKIINEQTAVAIEIGGIDEWIRESLELAQARVYSPQIRDYVASREHAGEFGKASLSKQYLRDGSESCRRRAYQAGRRLAVVITSTE